MEAYSVDKPIERAAVRRAAAETRMRWRERRYGFKCLTVREYEAITLEMRLRTLPLNRAERKEEKERDGRSLTLQQRIAVRWGISHQAVSDVLRRADEVMAYFADNNFDARWRRDHMGWWLDAPVADEE